MGLLDIFNHQYPYTDFHELNLDWLLKHFDVFVKSIDSLNNWKEQHEEEYEQLKDLYDDLIAGDYPDSFINSLKLWLNSNLIDIIGELIHNVFFGLTDSGYFVVYIPESWSDIIFNTTGVDINLTIQPEYGHLVLSY